MVTLKGYLASVGPGKPARLTQDQKDLVERAVRAVISFDSDSMSTTSPSDSFVRRIHDFAVEVVSQALDNYPTDRSCYTCDFENAGTCRNNDHAEIPLPFRAQGCDDWKDEGAPF